MFFLIISAFLVIIVFLFIYITIIEPQWLIVKKVAVTIDRLPKPFDGFKIVHLSDFHLDNHIKKDYIKKVVNTTLKLKPDIITFTGDMVNNTYKEIDKYADVLRQLTAKYGIYSVLGNHDYTDNPSALAEILENIWGNPVLINKSISIEKENKHIWIIGIDSCQVNPTIEKAIQNIPEEEIKLLLWHEPDFAELSNEYDVSLQLSGHTHGGQVNLSIIRDRVLPKHGKKYIKGKYRVGNMILYVNSGIGMSRFYINNIGYIDCKIRFNCRPEITCIILNTKKQ